MVFQDPMTSLNPTMTIGKQIAEAVSIHRDVSRPRPWTARSRCWSWSACPGRASACDDYPHQLSGGLRQRVMIAMALACEPKLLIADEPTTALDVTIQAQILRLLDELKRELGMGIVLITHDMGVIAGRADRVMVMYAGRKVETRRHRRAVHRLRHPYTEALLGLDPQARPGQDPGAVLDPRAAARSAQPAEGCRFAAAVRVRHRACRAEDPPLGGEDPRHPYACFYPRHSS